MQSVVVGARVPRSSKQLVSPAFAPRFARGFAVTHIKSHQQLKSAVQDKPTVVDFSAAWCGPCKVIAPVFEDLSNKYSEKIQCLKVDVDEIPEAAEEYRVFSVPTFIFFKNGETVQQMLGADRQSLARLMDQLASAPDLPPQPAASKS